MKINKRWITGGLTAAALAAVVTGTAVAQSTTPSESATNDSNQPGEVGEVDEAEPALNGSITAPDDESVNEADEASMLAETPGLITEADAIAAATADGGTADTATLENENGSVVYEVVVTAADGTQEEVKVDAGNGAVLAREADDEADDENEADEADGEADDDEEADGIDHQNEGDEGDHADEDAAGTDA